MLLAGVQAPRPRGQVAPAAPAFPRWRPSDRAPCSTARTGLLGEVYPDEGVSISRSLCARSCRATSSRLVTRARNPSMTDHGEAVGQPLRNSWS